MLTSDEIEAKINTYNTVRNFCLSNINLSENKDSIKCYMDVIKLIDAKMKQDNVEHYIYYINL